MQFLILYCKKPTSFSLLVEKTKIFLCLMESQKRDRDSADVVAVAVSEEAVTKKVKKSCLFVCLLLLLFLVVAKFPFVSRFALTKSVECALSTDIEAKDITDLLEEEALLPTRCPPLRLKWKRPSNWQVPSMPPLIWATFPLLALLAPTRAFPPWATCLEPTCSFPRKNSIIAVSGSITSTRFCPNPFAFGPRSRCEAAFLPRMRRARERTITLLLAFAFFLLHTILIFK